MKCTKCGSESNGKFCENCGASLEATENNSTVNQENPFISAITTDEPKKQIYKKWWFWVIIVVVVISIIVAAIGGTKESSVNKQENSLQSQSSELGTSKIDSSSSAQAKSSKPVEQSKPVEPSSKSAEPSKPVVSSKPVESSKSSTQPEQTISKYEQIYDEYAKKIRDAAPNVGITELATISNEGVVKMAEYMYKANGTDGQYATYEKWAGKLMDVYMNEAR